MIFVNPIRAYFCQVKIWVLGAGLSSSGLFWYLNTHPDFEDASIFVIDQDAQHLQQRLSGLARLSAMPGNAADPDFLRTILDHDLVISLLPPTLHVKAARICLEKNCHLITASYISPEMAEFNAPASEKGLLFLNECGLDPGIDHLSAMEILDKIRGKGGEIQSFKSYCGGLVSQNSDTNPWHYKFSWNPMNVVLAGQQTARCRAEGIAKFVTPARLFRETENWNAGLHGNFDAYLNRDSLGYTEIYGLEKASEIRRGTLRGEGFCAAWHILVMLGLTDDSYIFPFPQSSWKKIMEGCLPKAMSLLDFIKIQLPELTPEQHQDIYHKIDYLGLLNDEEISCLGKSPAKLLLQLLQEKWELKSGDTDRVVMIHEIIYTNSGIKNRHVSVMDIEGQTHLSAMSKTVGFPLGMAARIIFTQGPPENGVVIPVKAHWYKNMLPELESLGIHFMHQEFQLS